MTKERAKDSDLGDLHGLLARVLAAQVGEMVDEYDAEGEPTGRAYSATPALLTIAARFLKDNEITCAVEDSKDASALRDELKKRRTGRKKLASISHIDEDREALSG